MTIQLCGPGIRCRGRIQCRSRCQNWSDIYVHTLFGIGIGLVDVLFRLDLGLHHSQHLLYLPSSYCPRLFQFHGFKFFLFCFSQPVCSFPFFFRGLLHFISSFLLQIGEFPNPTALILVFHLSSIIFTF